MGKATGKHHAQRQPDIKALVPTNQMIGVRAFAGTQGITEGEALRVLLKYALNHSGEVAEDLEWQRSLDAVASRPVRIINKGDPITQGDLPFARATPCGAERGQFASPQELKNAT